jgi:predicted RNase H-like nuclease (RuvC/YqgF family)
METVWILNGGLGLGLAVLGVVYWRSQRSFRATQTQLNQELLAQKQTAAETQAKLEQRLQAMTQQWQTSQRDNAELNSQVDSLKQQCQRLRDRLETQAEQVRQDTQAKAFEQIQTLLTQYPSLRRMAEAKPELPARNVVALLTSLENLTQFWHYQPIGAPWESVAYDPQCHQGDAEDLQTGESVYVRFVGYRQGDRIVIPAKVSRTLPAGVAG